jgi:hypothetical protein
MLVGKAAPSGPVGRKALASRAGQFFASAATASDQLLQRVIAALNGIFPNLENFATRNLGVLC